MGQCVVTIVITILDTYNLSKRLLFQGVNDPWEAGGRGGGMRTDGSTGDAAREGCWSLGQGSSITRGSGNLQPLACLTPMQWGQGTESLLSWPHSQFPSTPLCAFLQVALSSWSHVTGASVLTAPQLWDHQADGFPEWLRWWRICLQCKDRQARLISTSGYQ